jgi:two-component system, sensor histidine kinase and response regulator
MNQDLTDYKQLILIIDDNPNSIHYLCDIFQDFRKAVTVSGIEGIALANKLKPDLILLDILMPEIDGYEVCKKIKENPENDDIPIIFLSGKTLLEDVVQGFKLGAVDYIVKPFEKEELMMRVKTNLELKASKDTIKRQNQKVLDLNDELNHFLSIATHDLLNSLLVIQGFNKLLLNNYTKFSDEEKLEILSDVTTTGDKMHTILTNLSLITKLEEGLITPYKEFFDINLLIQESINSYQETARNKGIKIELVNKNKSSNIHTDYSLVKECIDNLLSNATKFTKMGGTIMVVVYSETINTKLEPKIVIEVKDQGPGIKEGEVGMLFKKFAKLSSESSGKELNTGLGLAITQSIVKLLDGELDCISQFGKGSKFVIKIPSK